MKRRELLSWIGIFLLGAAPAAVLWLPVPNFLFASGGSGGACECIPKKCTHWELCTESPPTGNPPCQQASWDSCSEICIGHFVECKEKDTDPDPGFNKHMPESRFIYEAAPYCTRWGNAGPSGVVWKRCEPVDGKAGAGKTTIKWTSNVRLRHDSWNAAPCGDSDEDDSITGYGIVKALLKTCGAPKCQEKAEEPFTVRGVNYDKCWWLGKFDLKYDKNQQKWVLDPRVQTPDKYIETQFEISIADCPCIWQNADCNKLRRVGKWLFFHAAVEYHHGENPPDAKHLRMSNKVEIELEAVTDESACTVK